MRSKILFFLFTFIGTMFVSCSSDHDHSPYSNYYPYPYYNDHPYYYYDGRYYEDPYHIHPYAWDSHHFYSARIEWKGSGFGYGIVLRENPYNGMLCRPVNLDRYFATHDGEVMVRFNWLGDENNNGLIIPIIEIIDIHWK